MSVDEWSRTRGPEDITLGGLARLEAELLKPYPEVQASIEQSIGDFAPKAAEAEERHGGRELMAPVRARMNQDWRASSNFGQAFLSFLVVLLPSCAFGISVRGRWDYGSVVWTVATLLALTAVVCVIKVLSTLRDRVWVGVRPRWALWAALIGVATTISSYYVSTLITAYDSGAPLAVIMGSTAAIVAFAALAIYRQVAAARTLKADLADVQPRISAYLAEYDSAYSVALARIQDAVNTLDPPVRTKLLRDRNGVISHFAGNRGLYQGDVPLFMTKKSLGELQLLSVAEPLLGGGPYPVHGKPAKKYFTSSPT